MQNIKTSELRYRRLFETAQDGILILNAATGVIMDANPFLIRMLGYSLEEFMEKNLWEVGAFKDIEANRQAFETLQENEFIRYENLPLKTKNGKLIQVEFVSNVYMVGSDKVIQCNIRDITDRKNAEWAAAKATGELLTLVETLKKRDGEMKTLIHMDDLLQSCASLPEVYQVIEILLKDFFAEQSGGLAIFEQNSQHLEIVARWGDEKYLKTMFLLKDCWAMRRGQIHQVTNPGRGLTCKHFATAPQAGTLCLPLMVRGETLGMISLVDNEGGEDIARHQQSLIAVGEAIKLSISNIRLREELREQAIRDPLTGLYNRRYLEENLAREVYRTQRQKGQLCVAMLDMDGFKKINDTFGHAAGDLVLVEVSRILGNHLRNTDIVCRYGGDEFLLVLPDSSLQDNHQRLDQIRLLIKEHIIHFEGKILSPLSITIGMASAMEQGFAPNDLVQAADAALYTAKQSGSDQILIQPKKQVSPAYAVLPASHHPPDVRGQNSPIAGWSH